MAKRLLDLPDELLEQCFQLLAVDSFDPNGPVQDLGYQATCHVDLDADGYTMRQTLVALCRVSKRIANVAQPILYHRLYPSQGDAPGQYQKYYKLVQRRVLNPVRTQPWKESSGSPAPVPGLQAHGNQENGRQNGNVNGNGNGKEHGAGNGDHEESHGDKALLAVRNFRFDFAQVEDPTPAVLEYLHNVLSVDIDLDAVTDSSFLGELGEQLVRKKELACLSLFIDQHDERRVYADIINRILVRLTNLKYLYFNGFMVQFRDGFEVAPFRSNLRSIHLGDTDFGCKAMQMYLGNMQCETLETFSFCNYGTEKKVELIPIHLRKHIKRLRIDFSDALPYEETTLQETFPSLVALEINSPSTHPSERVPCFGFPETLRSLTLLSIDAASLDYFVGGLRIPAHLPKLERVEFYWKAIVETMDNDYERMGTETDEPLEDWQNVIQNLEHLDRLLKSRKAELAPKGLVRMVQDKYNATFGKRASA